MPRPIGYKTSQETKEKQRVGNLGKHFFKHTPESLLKIGESSKKKWQQKWYRDLMITAQKKHNSGQFPIRNKPWNYGLKLNPKSKQKTRFGRPVRNKVKKEKCAWCGTTEDLQLDHILAKCNGGDNYIENCQVLCRKCNLIKRDTIDLVPLQLKKKRANSVES